MRSLIKGWYLVPNNMLYFFEKRIVRNFLFHFVCNRYAYKFFQNYGKFFHFPNNNMCIFYRKSFVYVSKLLFMNGSGIYTGKSVKFLKNLVGYFYNGVSLGQYVLTKKMGYKIHVRKKKKRKEGKKK